MGRRVFLHINVSLDGYVERANHDIDWQFVDDEFEEYINTLLRSIDGMIFGRVAHQKLAEYWPFAAERAGDQSQAPDRGVSTRHLEAIELMNSLPKYVVTDGDYNTSWANSHLLPAHTLADAVSDLKAQQGKDLAVFAGAKVAQTFSNLGLLDEYRLVINPVLLGGGNPLFASGGPDLGLDLAEARSFQSGAVLLRYRAKSRNARSL